MSEPRDLVTYGPVSPSEYWKVRSWQYEAFPRRRGGTTRGLNITFEHIRENGDAIRVEVYVDRQQSLDTLIPFLDAARNLPQGFRLEAHVLEGVAWDVIRPPVRWSVRDEGNG